MIITVVIAFMLITAFTLVDVAAKKVDKSKEMSHKVFWGIVLMAGGLWLFFVLLMLIHAAAGFAG